MASAPPPDFSKLGDDMYKHWEKAMTQWWDATLDSPAFLGAMGKNLEGAARARGQYEKAVDQSLEKMHLPTRGDLVRVARVAALLEERLLQQEDHVLELKDRLGRMEKEVVEARIEAAEARLELRDTLAAIRGELALGRGATPRGTAAAAGAPGADEVAPVPANTESVSTAGGRRKGK